MDSSTSLSKELKRSLNNFGFTSMSKLYDTTKGGSEVLYHRCLVQLQILAWNNVPDFEFKCWDGFVSSLGNLQDDLQFVLGMC